MHEGCTHRPGEVKVESDGVLELLHLGGTELYRVVTKHGRDDVTERTGRGGVYLDLIMLEAYPEPGPTRAGTGFGPLTTTTLPYTVLAEPVHEGLEPQLEHPGALGLQQDKQRG